MPRRRGALLIRIHTPAGQPWAPRPSRSGRTRRADPLQAIDGAKRNFVPKSELMAVLRRAADMHENVPGTPPRGVRAGGPNGLPIGEVQASGPDPSSCARGRVIAITSPSGCHLRDRVPRRWFFTVPSDSQVPNPVEPGAPETGGPPRSVQDKFSSAPLTVVTISTPPLTPERAPYLAAFVASSWKTRRAGHG
jgi:hypothetical protein